MCPIIFLNTIEYILIAMIKIFHGLGKVKFRNHYTIYFLIISYYITLETTNSCIQYQQLTKMNIHIKINIYIFNFSFFPQ